MFEMVCGTVLLAVFIGILVLAYHIHMRSIYRDIADEEADEIADKRFEEAIKDAQVHVKQRLVIVDEMERHDPEQKMPHPMNVHRTRQGLQGGLI